MSNRIDSAIAEVESQVKHFEAENKVKQAESARRDDLQFRNNSALRDYLRGLTVRLLDEAAKPTDTTLEHVAYIEAINLKRGIIRAAGMIQEEIANLQRDSFEDYCS